MKKITELAHDFLKEINNQGIAIDFTCGHGQDTYFLANNFQKVYAFDIQEVAINDSKKLCANLNNIEFILDDHVNFDHYVDYFDVGIFNLGYLPNGDKSITTLGDNVVDTLKKALLLLSSKGRIVVVCYPGFMEGSIESNAVECFSKELERKMYDVAKFKIINTHHAPFIIIIDKH